MSTDVWGSEVTVSAPDSIAAWNKAWQQAMHFVDDPFVTLADANSSDADFVLGSVFCGTYRRLSGARADNNDLLVDLDRAQSRSVSPTDRAHAGALALMVEGNFTRAAQAWDEIAVTHRDFAAIRFAHDVYLHVGGDEGRLRSSQRAFDSWDRNEPGWGFLAGQLSFAMEEAGSYDDAEALGREALELDPMDLWSRHSLAHVYEMRNDNDAAFRLLADTERVWSAQDGLSVHMWWHLALRLIASGLHDEALAVHDSQLPLASTPFRLCDLISLLWRLELAGVDVGDRWDDLADRFADRPEWHTSGFLDVHAALLYTRRPNHDAAERFFAGVATSYVDDQSENAHIFAEIVQPLVGAIRNGELDPDRSVMILDRLNDATHRIGGSHAQRDILSLTRSHYEKLSSNSDHLEAK